MLAACWCSVTCAYELGVCAGGSSSSSSSCASSSSAPLPLGGCGCSVAASVVSFSGIAGGSFHVSDCLGCCVAAGVEAYAALAVVASVGHREGAHLRVLGPLHCGQQLIFRALGPLLGGFFVLVASEEAHREAGVYLHLGAALYVWVLGAQALIGGHAVVELRRYVAAEAGPKLGALLNNPGGHVAVIYHLVDAVVEVRAHREEVAGVFNPAGKQHLRGNLRGVVLRYVPAQVVAPLLYVGEGAGGLELHHAPGPAAHRPAIQCYRRGEAVFTLGQHVLHLARREQPAGIFAAPAVGGVGLQIVANVEHVAGRLGRY